MNEVQNYFMLTGTGAVTLMGLLFVIITLGVARSERGYKGLLPVFVTPTLVHLAAVFLIALLALSPERDSLVWPFGLVGITGLVYSLSIARKAIRYDGLYSGSWLPHGGIPFVCYAGIVTAACLGLTSTSHAYLVLRAVSALLLLNAMRNSWAVAADVAQSKGGSA